MGFILESEKGNVSGESRSQSFKIIDDIGGVVEFNWVEWDDFIEVVEQLKQRKPKEPK